MAAAPVVALVGAGPGHPGFITLRAVELLRQADLVLYDRLAAPGLLDHAPASAHRVCVEDLGPCHAERQPLILQTMIDAARRGLRVVRLKGGDPLVFGRGGEEGQALRNAGLAFEFVPGVSAALGAASCAGIPLTHRQYSSAVAFITGHEYPEKPGSLLDWASLARFPGTLVFYMGIGRLEAIARSLLAHGKSGDTPAALVEKATTSRQRTWTTTLAELSTVAQREQVQAPALVILGEVVALREQLAWFEHRPLFGRTVLITRPRHQADDMVRQVEALGGRALVLPILDIREPDDWAPVDRVLAELARFHWLVFTSSNGVEAFLGRLRHHGRDLRALGGIKLAAIGPATAEALRRYYLNPDLLPESFNSEGLVAALRERVIGQRVLLARANRGLELLRDELAKVAEVQQVAVYVQTEADTSNAAEVVAALGRGEIDFVSLTSSNIAAGFAAVLDDEARARILEGRVSLVSISPRTSGVIREKGLPVAGEASQYTTTGVLETMCQLSRSSERSA